MMLYKNVTWLLLLMAIGMVGCGKQIPGDVIQPNKMEEILYDYHLSISISSNIDHSGNYQKEAYRNYIFQKHQVTAAEFDSSMVWYTRHTKELAAIYKNLSTRFRDEKKKVAGLLSKREEMASVSLPGDTVDIWYNRKLYWLEKYPLADKVIFEIPSDSNFKAKDAFEWSADYTFLSEGRQKVVMGFNVVFDNDSVKGSIKDVTERGLHTLYIKPDSAYSIKSINGFLYYIITDSVDVETSGVIVNNITLTRYHALADSTDVVKVDDIAFETHQADSIKTNAEIDSTQVQQEQAKEAPTRLNPREMRNNINRTDTNAKKNTKSAVKTTTNKNVKSSNKKTNNQTKKVQKSSQNSKEDK